MKLVDVLKHAYFVGEGVEYLLREAIDWTYEKCGLYDGSHLKAPTFFQVKEYIFRKPLKGRMSLWKASAMRVLESLCFRHGLGPVANSDVEWNYEKLLRSSVVMELEALSDSDKIFLTEAIVLWIYEFRKNEGKREQFKHALVIEEGHHILSHQKENFEGVETIMETSLRQIREFGEAVIVIDQEPTKLSNSIKANTYGKITFNLGNGKDILEIANCMGLTKEESEYLPLLDVAQVDTDADMDLLGLFLFVIMGTELALNSLGTLHRMHDRGELHQKAIPGGLNDMAVMHGHGLLDEVVVNFQQPQHARFIAAHLAAKAHDVSKHDSGQLAGLGLHRLSPWQCSSKPLALLDRAPMALPEQTDNIVRAINNYSQQISHITA